MKRSVAVIAIALTAAASAYSQASLQGFQTAFTTFAGDLAGSLAMSSTIGSTWSDAYVGGFPHLGAGVSVGTTFVSASGATSLFDAISPGSLPSQLTSLGIPLPVAVGTFKIGLPFLPLDIGVKGGYIPSSVGASILSSSGISVDYANIGLQVRYALLKQNLILPNISIGAAYNYQQGSISKEMTGVPSQSFSVPPSLGSYNVSDQPHSRSRLVVEYLRFHGPGEQALSVHRTLRRCRAQRGNILGDWRLEREHFYNLSGWAFQTGY